MQRIIKFDDPLYSRMYWVDMRDVPKDLQWKVLEYHNQKFVLDKIVGGAFTEEQHRNFLEHLDEIIEKKHRYQYIVYFDDRPVEKYSFTIDGDIVKDTGNFLFFEKDLRSGIGFLGTCFFYRYVFEVLNAKKMSYSAYLSNRKQVSFLKKLGSKIVDITEDKVFFEYDKETHFSRKASFEELLQCF